MSYGAGGTAHSGTLSLPPTNSVLYGVQYGEAGDSLTGGLVQDGISASAGDVRLGVALGGGFFGTLVVPSPDNVRHGVASDATSGLCYVPDPANVLVGIQVNVNSIGELGLVRLSDLLPLDPDTGAMTLTIGDDTPPTPARCCPSPIRQLARPFENGTTLTLYVRNAGGAAACRRTGRW